MPHKAPHCPKCKGRSKQVEFLEANPHISDNEVLRGKAKFRCKYCKLTFIDLNGGIKRIGASRTYREYHPKKDGMRKFRVTWWISGAGRIVRGSDLVPFLSTMTKDDAENLMEADLSKIREEEEYKLKLPNFCAKHDELTCAARHSEVSNFGILRVVELIG